MSSSAAHSHHRAAAHHEKAAWHHRQAARHYEAGDHQLAAHHGEFEWKIAQHILRWMKISIEFQCKE